MSRVLLVVDVQNDFLPGGALGVADGDQIIPVVNKLIEHFEHVIVTQDWHPADHVSFAANHRDAQAFDTVTLPYGEQVLWPVHCVQGTDGAALAASLQAQRAQLVLRKGYHRNIDSYSVFMEADRCTDTGLAGYLRSRGLDEVFICGLATDFCVSWSAQDACAMGFETTVIEDACRAIDLNGSLQQAWEQMDRAGVRRICAVEVLTRKKLTP